MSLQEDNSKWVKRGRQRSAVVRVLRKPMTASEICLAAHPINPHIQLRDVWFLMGQLNERGLAVCLNPRDPTGKLYALTPEGRRLAELAFGMRVDAVATDVDWRKYAQVVRAKVRKLVLLELARLPAEAVKTATTIRKGLRDRHPIGLNPTIRALKDLERLGLVRSATLGKRDARKSYVQSKAGAAVARELLR